MSEYTPTTEAIQRMCSVAYAYHLDENAPDITEEDTPEGPFVRWLAEHDRKVAAKAWEEGAIAAWNRSGKQVFGESYEELNFIPLSLRETNPYEQKRARK